MASWSDISLSDVRDALAAQLPRESGGGGAEEVGGGYWVRDVAVDARSALICSWEDGEEKTWVADVTREDDGEFRLAVKETWTEVEEVYVPVRQAVGRGWLRPGPGSRMLYEVTREGTNAVTALQTSDLLKYVTMTVGQSDANVAETDVAETEAEEQVAAASSEYVVTKAVEEKRYTFGPLYAPDRLDAHGEYTDAETLEEAVWDYVRGSAEQGRRLRLQHGDFGDVTVAEWVSIVAWPYESEITVSVPGEAEKAAETKTVTLPAGTVYMGVIWDEEVWPLVKSGKIAGFSLGGRAVRVREKSGIPTEKMGGEE